VRLNAAAAELAPEPRAARISSASSAVSVFTPESVRSGPSGAAHTGIEPAQPPSLDLSSQLAAQRRRRVGWMLAAALLLLAIALLSLGLGSGPLTPTRLLQGSAAGLGLAPAPWRFTDSEWLVLVSLRLPRMAMAIVTGAGLAMAGVAMQGITRNPLVSPYTLGVSPAAAFGASLAILFGLAQLPGWGSVLTVLCAFAAATACAVVVLGLAAVRSVSPVVLVLAGVGLTYLFGALTASVQFVASEQQLAAIVHWTFGSLNGRTWTEVALAGGAWSVAMPLILGHAAALNALAGGGDDVARTLGFAVARVRATVTLAAVFGAAAIVSFTGVIGFVGLVAPHIARLTIGGDHRWLLPFSALAGAVLVLAADLIGRLAFAPVAVPVGIVVAFIGVPLFLHLLLTRRHEVGS
jgi:iron complex transport system permease protein